MGAYIAIFALIFIVGICIGSFLNVVILRSLSEESIVFPASKCPKCQTPLKWWHNIPIISYIFLKGKCAFCKEPISIQYPIIELFTGIIFTLIFWKYGFSFDTLFLWAISSMFVVIAGTDIKEKVVFDVHTYILMGLGFAYAIYKTSLILINMNNAGIPFVLTGEFLMNNPITLSIFGALAGALILEIFARFGYVLAGTRAFGEGDTLIAAGLGAVFGWKSLLWVLVLSVVIQVIMFFPFFIKRLIADKEWRTLAVFMGFVVYATAFYVVQESELLSGRSPLLSLVLSLILAFLGILSCVMILRNMKNKSKTYIPFGPALVLAALFFLIR